MTTTLGIIGCGRFVHHYHIPALRRRADVRLAWICDPQPSVPTMRLAADTTALVGGDVSELLEAVVPDAVLVSSPHGLHADHIESCLRAGAHVLVDKPFTLRSSDARHLAQLASELGLVGAVAFNRRLDNGFTYARKLVESGSIGQLLHVESIQLGYPAEGWYSDPVLAGGGPFVGRGAHVADIVPWLTGRPATSVAAVLLPLSRGRDVDRGGYIAADLGGVTWHATIIGVEAWNLDEVRLYGSAGSVVIRRPADETISWQAVYLDLGDEERGRSTLGQRSYALDDFLGAIANGDSPACAFAEAVHSVVIVETAFASAQSGGIAVDVVAKSGRGVNEHGEHSSVGLEAPEGPT